MYDEDILLLTTKVNQSFLSTFMAVVFGQYKSNYFSPLVTIIFLLIVLKLFWYQCKSYLPERRIKE